MNQVKEVIYPKPNNREYKDQFRVIKAEIEGVHSASTIGFIKNTLRYVMDVLDRMYVCNFHQLESGFDIFNGKDQGYKIGRSGSHIWLHKEYEDGQEERVAIIHFEIV